MAAPSDTQKLSALRPRPLAAPETRALWLPAWTLADADQLKSNFETVADCGFNTVALEAVYRGLTSFTSETAAKYGVLSEYPKLRGAEPLAQACAAAVDAGLAVYATVDLMLAGARTYFPASRLWHKRRRWLIRNEKMLPMEFEAPEPQSLFLCAANPDARRYAGELLAEIAQRYAVDGLMISNILPPGFGAASAICQCAVCRERVDHELFFSVAEVAAEGGAHHYPKWREWYSEQAMELFAGAASRIRVTRRKVCLAVKVPAPRGVADLAPGFAEQVLADGLAHVRLTRLAGDIPQKDGLALEILEEGQPAEMLPRLAATRGRGNAGFIVRCQRLPEESWLRAMASAIGPDTVPIELDPAAAAMRHLDILAARSDTAAGLKERIENWKAMVHGTQVDDLMQEDVARQMELEAGNLSDGGVVGELKAAAMLLRAAALR
ncbi:MAG: hypothetical protein K1X53_06540 [Candidatus Sumerlaeaceae bacterium]|nr:hypothetical protein [Candidatus Sumerlaeaceae bacterium]